MPHDGVIFIAERSRRGSQKLLWSVMAITAIATDVRISAIRRFVSSPLSACAGALSGGLEAGLDVLARARGLAGQQGTCARTDACSTVGHAPGLGSTSVELLNRA
jgi:hypothetical protein